MSPASPRQKKQKLDLLPSNALASERALSLAVEFEDDLLPEDIKALWRPEQVAARFLPFLAWGLHVDFWRDFWSEELKRQLIAGSFEWHRKKGTIWAVRKVLEDLNFVPTIKEWFEPSMGTKPHTFSITGHYKNDPLHIDFLGPDTEAQLIQAVEVAKPLRSHLIFLIVAPPPPDMSDHICRWDWCTWDHGTAHEYTWGRQTPTVGIWEGSAALGITLGRIFFGAYTREDRWDVELWDHGRHDGMTEAFAGGLGTAIFGAWEDYAPRHKWHKRRTWRCGGTWRSSCEHAAVAVIGFKEVD